MENSILKRSGVVSVDILSKPDAYAVWIIHAKRANAPGGIFQRASDRCPAGIQAIVQLGRVFHKDAELDVERGGIGQGAIVHRQNLDGRIRHLRAKR